MALPDIEIARQAKLRPITEIGRKLGIPADELIRYGDDKAKIRLPFIEQLADRPHGKLILVTAINPTPAGEGKTTATIGLTDALNQIGKKTTACIREPSLGPCFGMKGGAAGGGFAQVVPMEDINLHFTGDMHAISAAHNLLAALIDNYIHWSNEIRLDLRRILWRRVVDINDRQLRKIVSGIGGPGNGFPMESGFDISVASEVMAIFCLAENLSDLQQRLDRVLIGYTRDGQPVSAAEVKASGAMSVLLKDALAPNLVQTLEHNPVLIHGGPFANIAHGCNSVIATKTALKLSDYVVTEAGFGADLGAEKFFNIKCRKSGLKPDASVLVATVRALKMHGGADKATLQTENLAALRKGIKNLDRHVRNLAQFGIPVTICINRFDSDSDAELELIKQYAEQHGVKAFICSHWADGGAGAEALAREVAERVDSQQSQFRTLYDDDMSLWHKTQHIARSLYGADDITADMKIRNQFRQLQSDGYGHFPICMAKTQYSFSTDPKLLGAPNNHVVPIRELSLSAGAEFLVVICGEIMRMPGLPREPAANNIRINDSGLTEGLF